MPVMKSERETNDVDIGRCTIISTSSTLMTEMLLHYTLPYLIQYCTTSNNEYILLSYLPVHCLLEYYNNFQVHLGTKEKTNHQ